MGGSIVGLRRWRTVPPAAFYKVDYQPLEGETDVSSGDVRSGAAGLHGDTPVCFGFSMVGDWSNDPKNDATVKKTVASYVPTYAVRQEMVSHTGGRAAGGDQWLVH